jgi:hypothetical protein
LDDWNKHKDVLSHGLSDQDWIPVDHAFMELSRIVAIAVTASGTPLPHLNPSDFGKTYEYLDSAFQILSRVFPVTLAGLPKETVTS